MDGWIANELIGSSHRWLDGSLYIWLGY